MNRLTIIATCLYLLASGAATAGEVRLYSWEAYFAADTIKQFETETGNKITYDVFDSNDMVETRILAGDSGYDVVTPNLSPHFARQLPLNVWSELDKGKLGNLSNLDPGLMAKLAEIDPDNRHAVAWMWGTTGIGHNVEMIEKIMPDAPVNSWRMVFDPAIAAKFKECGIAMLDDAEQVLGSALIYLGLDPDSNDPAEIEKAVELVAKIRPYVRQFHGSSYVNALAGGDLCVALGYSGDMLVATNRAKEAGKSFTIDYRRPEEGALVWFDTLAIPADAPNKEGALAFIDFMMRPEVAAKAANELGFATANQAALPQVAEAIRANVNFYPTTDMQKSLRLPKVKTEKQSKALERAWNRAKGIE